jgi:hypothetical protein
MKIHFFICFFDFYYGLTTYHKENQMIPLDPNKAAKLGETWGKTVTDSVFGIVDVVDKHKAKVAHVNAVNEANKGALDHNKKVSDQTKILKQMAIAEEERAQEIAILQAMSPKQRDEYYKAKIAAGKAKAKKELEEAEAAAENAALMQIIALIFIGVPLIVYFFLFFMVTIFAYTDRASYRELAKFVPFATSVYGKY